VATAEARAMLGLKARTPSASDGVMNHRILYVAVLLTRLASVVELNG
jgi:hypothetical protein